MKDFAGGYVDPMDMVIFFGGSELVKWFSDVTSTYGALIKRFKE